MLMLGCKKLNMRCWQNTRKVCTSYPENITNEVYCFQNFFGFFGILNRGFANQKGCCASVVCPTSTETLILAKL